MKYVCSCGKYESDNPTEFYTHVAEGQKAGVENHARVVEATVSQPARKTREIRKQPKAQRSDPVDVRSLLGNKWLVIGLAAFGFLGSLGLGNMWLKAKNPNMALGILVIVLFAGCPILIWRAARSSGGTGRRNASTRVMRPVEMNADGPTLAEVAESGKVRGVKNEAPKLEGEVNAFNIYVRLGKQDLGENHLVPVMAEFAHMERRELLGQPKMLLNDRKYYHVHILGPEANAIRAFALNDAAFVDPALMARYLDAPCQRSYVEFIRETMAKWVGPGLLALMDGILLLVIYLRLSAT